MPEIGIILNPKSKSLRENPARLNDFKSVVARNSGRCALYATETQGEIYDAAKKFLSEKFQILAIEGGDGTAQATISEFIKAYEGAPLPRIVLLGGGTMNTLSNSLKMKGAPLRRLLRTIDSRKIGERLKTVDRNILRINERYGFIFGTGVYHRFIDLYQREAYPSIIKGFLLLSKVAIGCLVNSKLASKLFEASPCKVTVDGNVIDLNKSSTVTCSTVQYIGYGFNLYSKALKNPDTFHMIMLPDKPSAIAFNIPRFFLGRLDSIKGLYSKAACKVTIEADSPIGYQLDGELFCKDRKIDVCLGPRLRFLLP